MLNRGVQTMIKFLLGESRPLEFEITQKDNEPFVIRDSSYELYKDNVVVDSGNMEISDHILSYVFTPESRGFYLFKFTYTIGDSTRAAQYHINVD